MRLTFSRLRVHRVSLDVHAEESEETARRRNRSWRVSVLYLPFAIWAVGQYFTAEKGPHAWDLARRKLFWPVLLLSICTAPEKGMGEEWGDSVRDGAGADEVAAAAVGGAVVLVRAEAWKGGLWGGFGALLYDLCFCVWVKNIKRVGLLLMSIFTAVKDRGDLDTEVRARAPRGIDCAELCIYVCQVRRFCGRRRKERFLGWSNLFSPEHIRILLHISYYTLGSVDMGKVEFYLRVLKI